MSDPLLDFLGQSYKFTAKLCNNLEQLIDIETHEADFLRIHKLSLQTLESYYKRSNGYYYEEEESLKRKSLSDIVDTDIVLEIEHMYITQQSKKRQKIKDNIYYSDTIEQQQQQQQLESTKTCNEQEEIKQNCSDGINVGMIQMSPIKNQTVNTIQNYIGKTSMKKVVQQNSVIKILPGKKTPFIILENKEIVLNKEKNQVEEQQKSGGELDVIVEQQEQTQRQQGEEGIRNSSLNELINETGKKVVMVAKGNNNKYNNNLCHVQNISQYELEADIQSYNDYQLDDSMNYPITDYCSSSSCVSDYDSYEYQWRDDYSENQQNVEFISNNPLFPYQMPKNNLKLNDILPSGNLFEAVSTKIKKQNSQQLQEIHSNNNNSNFQGCSNSFSSRGCSEMILSLTQKQKGKQNKKKYLYCHNKKIPEWAENMNQIAEISDQMKISCNSDDIFGKFLPISNLQLQPIFQEIKKTIYMKSRGSSANWKNEKTLDSSFKLNQDSNNELCVGNLKSKDFPKKRKGFLQEFCQMTKDYFFK